MRVSVASTGGGGASASSGKAARRNARYSSTGSTTQPSAEGTAFWAEPAAAAKTIERVRQRALTAITAIVGAHLYVRPARSSIHNVLIANRCRHEANVLSSFIVSSSKDLRSGF